MIYIVKGLSYGDEGKGSIVDYLTLNRGNVVKDGGPQAAHHIVSVDGKLHRSEQMGSGVFNRGVRTFISKNTFVIPQNIVYENVKLLEVEIYDGMERLLIDSRCSIVTPYHQMIGRLKEIVRTKKHGSTGMGVGQAVFDKKNKEDKVLCMKDMLDEDILKDKVINLSNEKFKQADYIVGDNPLNKEVKDMLDIYYRTLFPKYIINIYRNFILAYPNCIEQNGEGYLNDLLESDTDSVFEGSQGALLDPEFGFKPYVTPIKPTFDMSEKLINKKIAKSNIERIGVIRAYSTRHGNGPFVTEDKTLTKEIPDIHNEINKWQGTFKIGWLDLLAIRYGIMINKHVNSIALTNLDRLSQLNVINICTSYEYQGKNEELLDEFFEYENVGLKHYITEFKNPTKQTDEIISNILYDCKPLEFKTFLGWKTPIHNVKTIEDLPKEVIKYLNFLQSEDGINKPISIISVGETSDNKILVK